jgi:adenylosuccinate lyase
MGRVWSEENRFRRWLDVELAATETLAERGVVPRAAAETIRQRARVDAGVVSRIAELEARVRHDVIAFTIAIGETIGDPAAARWLHYGLTSNDVVDTAQSLLIREASAKCSSAAPANFSARRKSAAPTASTPSPSLSD